MSDAYEASHLLLDGIGDCGGIDIAVEVDDTKAKEAAQMVVWGEAGQCAIYFMQVAPSQGHSRRQALQM